MARPHKSGVDFFSHDADASSKKTLFTLENRFGNDGYAFWFKLLEMLANQDGLYLDCKNPAEWLFLVAKTRVSEDTATEILDTLARVEAIDPELWAHKVIWVQKFVDRLDGVYRKRGSEIPRKPSFCTENPGEDDVSGAKMPQSKVKESTVNKSTKDHVCFEESEGDDSGKLAQLLNHYPPEFEEFWQTYPQERRREKKAAYRAWKARLKAGAKPEQLITAATHYAQECIGKEARYIKLPKTFLGPDCHWEEYQQPRRTPQAKKYTHQRDDSELAEAIRRKTVPLGDLHEVINRKTMVGIQGGGEP